ncbi:O-antigen ligase family protein [Candidatus Pseudothioglobus singularis]|nr:O-antigen ligase family protein [Candidatus Pseudothioglobus singularis]
MINNLIPFLVLGYFLLYIKKTGVNNLLLYLMFVSFFVFATNYSNYGLDIDIFRYLHRVIGIAVILDLVFHIIRNKINFFKDSIPQIQLIFFLVLLLSFFGNDLNMPHYLHYVRNFIFVASICLYLFYKLDSNKKLDNLFGLVKGITILLSCFIFLEFFQKGWEDPVRLFYGNANYLAYSLLLGLSLILFSKSGFKKIVTTFIVIIAIFATGSRAAELATLFIIICYLFNVQYPKKYLISFFLVGLTLVIFFSEQIIKNKNYNNTRTLIAQVSFNIFKDNPINGLGYGQFRTQFRDYISQDIFNKNNNEVNDILRGYRGDFPSSEILASMDKIDKANQGLFINTEKMTHNDLLTVVTELGLIGLFCVIFFFYKLYIELSNLLLYKRSDFLFSIGIIGGSLIFSLFHNNMTSFVFWFVLFIPFIMNRNYKKLQKL